jgi:hypothetical protein
MFPEVLVIKADITEESIWEDERLSSYDLLIALTDKDELNIITSTYAKRMGTSHCVALVKTTQLRHPGPSHGHRHRRLHLRGHRRYVDALHPGENIASIHSLFDGAIEVSEYKLLEGNELLGKQLKDVSLSGKVIVTGVTDKDGKAFWPMVPTPLPKGIPSWSHGTRACGFRPKVVHVNLKQDCKLLAVIQLFLGIRWESPPILHGGMERRKRFRRFSPRLPSRGPSPLWCFSLLENKSTYMGTNDGLFFVTFTWVIGTAFSALPLFLSHCYPTYTDAYFETMSGFTTTGATVLTSIEDKPLSILFWRSMTNWLGGMGIVVLFVAFLPMLGVTGTILVNSESVGPTKDKLTPKIGQTALIL